MQPYNTPTESETTSSFHSAQNNPYVGQPFYPPKKNKNGLFRFALITLIVCVCALLALLAFTFLRESYEITVSSSNPLYGSVEGSGVYKDKSQIEISAEPENGCIFYQWSDGSTDPTRTVQVHDNASYTAIFYGPLSDWTDSLPTDALVEEEQTQYRQLIDRKTTQDPTLPSGYILAESNWQQVDSDTKQYVRQWPSGFDFYHYLYRQYSGSPSAAAMETDSKKVEVTENVAGYIYWHWCRGERTKGPINRNVDEKWSPKFDSFHAYFSTSDPMASGPVIPPSSYDSGPVDNPSDGGMYHRPNADCCTDTYWFYPIEVMQQTAITYVKIYTYELWSEPSSTNPGGSNVVTTTIYRYRPA